MFPKWDASVWKQCFYFFSNQVPKDMWDFTEEDLERFVKCFQTKVKTLFHLIESPTNFRS